MRRAKIKRVGSDDVMKSPYLSNSELIMDKNRDGMNGKTDGPSLKKY